MIYFENYLWYVITLPGCAWQTCLIQMLFGLWRYAGLGKEREQQLTARETLRRSTGLASAPRLVRRSWWSDKSSALALGARRHTASRRRLRAGR